MFKLKKLVNFIQDRVLLSLVILFSTITLLKLTTLSHGTGSHPDERHIIMSIMRMSLQSWEQLNPGSFAYGGIPFYLLFFIKEFCNLINIKINYDNAFLLGRFVSSLLGIGCCYLVYLITQIFWSNLKDSKFWSFCSVILLSTNWFFFQNSRYYTVDIFLTFFSLLFFYFVCQFYKNQKFLSLLGIVTAFSLAFSSKISALNLGVFVALLPIMLVYKKKFKISSVINFYLLFLILSSVCICLLQPHAVQNYHQFFEDINRELSMVRGEYIPPYTLQYVKTIPYIYHLKQLFLYTIGPIETCLFILGIILVIKNARKNNKIVSIEVLYIVWVILVFMVIGKFQVKFPRYLLPLYPSICVFAIYAIQLFPFKIISKKLALFLVTSQSLIYLFSYFGIIFSDHTSVIASKWMKENITPHQMILQPHWDDWIPVKIPIRYPLPSKALNIYEHDTIEKWKEISNDLALADYLIFPSQKISSSFEVEHEKYYITRPFLLKLFSHKLPYELVATAYADFSFGPFSINIYDGDESLTVYDAPKVQIFKNMGNKTLSSVDIYNQIVNNTDLKLIEYSDLKSLKASSPITIYDHHSSWFELLKWILIFLFLPLITLPIITFFTKPNFALFYSANKILGPVTISFLYWFLVKFNIITFSPINIRIYLVFLFLISSLAIIVKKDSLITILLNNSKIIFLIESLGIFFFLAWSLHRTTFPEIFWSEKPMDFGFLNYFIRSDNPIVPTDPWASGSPMKYYYFSSYFLAYIHKAFNIYPPIGFNLSLAQIASWLAISFSSFFLIFSKSKKNVFIAVIISLFYCNSEPLRLFILEKRIPDFNLFWSTSRVFSIPGFSEYPLWSFLFSDVHAHVFTLPLTIIFMVILTYSLNYFLNNKILSTGLIFSLSLCWTFLGLCNGWDFIFYSLLILFLFLIFSFCKFNVIRSKFYYSLNFIIAGLLTLMFIFPYFLIISRSEKPDLFWQRNLNEFNTIFQFCNFYGTILLPLIGLAILTIVKNSLVFVREQVVLVSTFFTMILTWFILKQYFNITLQYNIQIFVFSLFVFFIILLTFKKENDPSDQNHNFILILLSFLPFAWILTEHVVLIDRMNTIFKFYYPIWIILSLSVIALLLIHFEKKHVYNKFTNFILILFIYLPIIISMISSSFNIYMMSTHSWKNTNSITLNGLSYLEYENPSEYNLYSWMNKNIAGTPTIAEAFGISYASFSRASMHTGLPTILGWEHHVYQRGLNRRLIREREQDLRILYSSLNIEEKINLIRKYNVKYVVIGPNEKNSYFPEGINLFFESPKLFDVVFHQDDYALIKIKEFF